MTRKHHRIVSALAVALVGAAIAAPAAFASTSIPDTAALNGFRAAQARDAVNQAPAVQPNPDQIGSGPGSLSAHEFATLTQPQPQVVQVESNPGFDWGDAGIGAGAMFALAMIGLGGALVVSSRRRQDRAATTA
jgi:hypothetical protein